MKPVVYATVAASILSISAFAFADVSKKDQEFITKAAGGGLFEVEAGKLAQSQAKTDGVQTYGGMLVKDHSAANDELKALAAKKGATVPTSVPADMKKKLDKLAKAKDFDKEFVAQVGLEDHKTDIALFEKASSDADDADVKAFATKTLPTLKTHKEHAEALSKAEKQ